MRLGDWWFQNPKDGYVLPGTLHSKVLPDPINVFLYQSPLYLEPAIPIKKKTKQNLHYLLVINLLFTACHAVLSLSQKSDSMSCILTQDKRKQSIPGYPKKPLSAFSFYIPEKNHFPKWLMNSLGLGSPCPGVSYCRWYYKSLITSVSIHVRLACGEITIRAGWVLSYLKSMNFSTLQPKSSGTPFRLQGNTFFFPLCQKVVAKWWYGPVGFPVQWCEQSELSLGGVMQTGH